MIKTTEKFIEDTRSVLRHNNEKPEQYGSNLGLEVLDGDTAGEPWIRYCYHVAPEHRNPYQGVHGGISAAVLDTALGVAACALTDRMPTTTELALSYLRPMNGDIYYVVADYTKIGRNLVSVSGSLQDGEGKKYVTAQARYALMGEAVIE